MSVRTVGLAGTVCFSFLTAIPTVAGAQASMAATPDIPPPPDILEPFNRAMFGFNTFVVDYIVDPAIRILGNITPGFVQRIGSNIYENISEPEFVFTNLLAGQPKDASVSAGRFAVNSTVGIAGIFDVATPVGLERRTTEFSEAMCKVGVPPGPYLILPFIGPTNLFSGGLLAVTLAAEWYVLSLVSAALAAGDAIFDVSVSAASLRHVRDLPEDQHPDHYALQQQEFWDYVKAGCAPPGDKAVVTATGVRD
jgi:phospholipid-binding lipoprotein MlaA